MIRPAAAAVADCGRRAGAAGDCARAELRPKSASISRSPSADRSPRSSTAMPRTSSARIPAIKVTPIYAGTYQDTLTKAQTALKANAGPQMAVLLSTDVFSLIDDDLIVPFDDAGQAAEDKAWLAQLLSRRSEERRDRRPYLGRAVPALDDRAVLEQGRLPGGRARSRAAAGDLGGACRHSRRS